MCERCFVYKKSIHKLSKRIEPLSARISTGLCIRRERRDD
jgi:hypothetical protein